MDLFSEHVDVNENLLPYDGTVNYFGKIIEKSAADNYFEILVKTINWKNDEAVIYGKKLITKRKVAWYGEREFEYTYSNTTKKAQPFNKELLELKYLAEQVCGETFNSCLLNLYHNGDETMAWHSDAEKDLKKNGAIGSLSFGAERKFAFKHKRTGEKISVLLEHGSLLVMKDQTQTFWLHRLPPTTKVKTPRINLTFRTISERR
jgi:alkylated DNA repair dioxygenase AlkB